MRLESLMAEDKFVWKDNLRHLAVCASHLYSCRKARGDTYPQPLPSQLSNRDLRMPNTDTSLQYQLVNWKLFAQ